MKKHLQDDNLLLIVVAVFILLFGMLLGSVVIDSRIWSEPAFHIHVKFGECK